MAQQSSQTHIYEPSPLNGTYRKLPPRSRIHRSWKRLLIFAGVFIVVAALSLAFTFARPPIYESSADLLIEPKNPNSEGQDASTYDIALQEQVLLSRSLLSDVLTGLSSTDYTGYLEPFTVSALRPMLHVTTRSDSAVIRLTAAGPNKAILPVIVNSWIDRYVGMNSKTQQAYSNSTTVSLHQQIETLNNKIEKKREELEQLRQKYDIVTLERDGNKVLSTLKGLNNSLNKATENRTLAEANLRSVKEAIEQGKWAGNYKKTTELLRLEEKADEMEELVRDYEARYTPQFLEIDKNTRTTIDRYHRLIEEIQSKHTELKTVALEEAEQAIISARHAENDLRAQIASYEKKAAEFSGRFSEYESLKENLLELEKLSREYQKEMVAMEIKSDADLLQIKVLERAFLPESPSRPNYVRDAAISVVVSLLLAIAAVLIFDFLTRAPAGKEDLGAFPVTYNQVFQSLPSQTHSELQGTPASQNLLPPAEQILSRELSDVEIKKLYVASSDATQSIIAGLFNGLRIDEIIRLKWKNIDFDTGKLKASGASTRTIPLTPLYRSILLKNLSVTTNGDEYILRNEKSAPFPLKTTEECILEAAEQAQIRDPQQITPEALRHTYISFLARQGIHLQGIEQIVGPIPDSYHTIYQIMSPPGIDVSIETAQLALPALQEFV